MRVLIAEGQKTVRHALIVLLTAQPGLQVVGEAADGKELLAQVCAGEVDLVVMDWDLPGLAEVGGLPALRRACPTFHVVVLSGRPGARRAAQAAGIDAFVSQGDPPERLLAAVRECGEAVS